jgi:hypothetical protein
MTGKDLLSAVIGLALLGGTVFVISWSVSKGWEKGKS